MDRQLDSINFFTILKKNLISKIKPWNYSANINILSCIRILASGLQGYVTILQVWTHFVELIQVNNSLIVCAWVRISAYSSTGTGFPILFEFAEHFFITAYGDFTSHQIFYKSSTILNFCAGQKLFRVIFY